MPQIIERLSALFLTKVKKPGLYPDGGNLYLQVSGDGQERVNKSWLFKYEREGRKREMGLGSCRVVGLKDAREKAKVARQLLLDGIDPLAARDAERAEKKLAEAAALSFKEGAEQYIKAHRAGWKNAKHADQWSTSLETYVYPLIGDLPIQKVDTSHVLKVLTPIWSTKTETASRIRGRIENILDWAKVQNLRSGDNAARWKGHLDKLLPRRSKVQKVKHHPALPYAEIGAFMRDLRKQEGIAARALEHTILTIARTTETLLSTWPEIASSYDVWNVPAGRMKGDREHRVPLSEPAAKNLRNMRKVKKAGSDLIFPRPKDDKPLSENAMLAVLDRMGFGHVTVHGFRSTFRDWAAECTDYPDAVAEVALAHVNDDETEAAYMHELQAMLSAYA